MKNLKLFLLGLCLSLLTNLPAHAILDNIPHQFTLGANYNLSLQNPFGDIPISNLNLTLTPSVILSDTHELGINVGYTLNRINNTLLEVVNKTSTLTFGPYYRFNFLLNSKDSTVPVMAYLGPQFGLSILSSFNRSVSNFSVGAQCGLNFMFSKNLALNFHIIQSDTVFDTETQLILTQSVGIRYYFQ